MEKNEQQPAVPIDSTGLVDSAKVGIDAPRRRGAICRGAYICDAGGRYYMTHSGEWTDGIKGDDNWWDDETEARNALLKLQEATTEVSRRANKTRI